MSDELNRARKLLEEMTEATDPVFQLVLLRYMDQQGYVAGCERGCTEEEMQPLYDHIAELTMSAGLLLNVINGDLSLHLEGGKVLYEITEKGRAAVESMPHGVAE